MLAPTIRRKRRLSVGIISRPSMQMHIPPGRPCARSLATAPRESAKQPDNRIDVCRSDLSGIVFVQQIEQGKVGSLTADKLDGIKRVVD